MRNRLFIVLLMICAGACTTEHNQWINYYKKAYPVGYLEWPTGPVQRIAPSLESPLLEFSADGTLLCTYLRPTFDNAGNVLPTRRAVYTVGGNEIREALDAQGFFTAGFLPQFSRAVPKASNHFSYFSAMKNYREKGLLHGLPWAEFLKTAYSWRMSPDGDAFIVLTGSVPGDYGQENVHHTVALWQGTPLKKVWEIKLQKAIEEWLEAEFIEFEGKQAIFVADDSQFFIFDRESGKELDCFKYKENLSDEELLQWVRRMVPKMPKREIGSLTNSIYSIFRGGVGQVDPRQRLFAVGGHFGRRIKVISLDKPHKTVFDLNANDDPRLWVTERVEFCGGHYLMVDYDFSCGGGKSLGSILDKTLFFSSTDIFDMKTGKRVWRENGKEGDVGNAVLSPDAKKMAVLRKGVIEIGEFKPRIKSELNPSTATLNQ